LQTLYAPDAVSVEPMAFGDQSPTTEAAIAGKPRKSDCTKWQTVRSCAKVSSWRPWGDVKVGCAGRSCHSLHVH
jgi:hypothetical protein